MLPSLRPLIADSMQAMAVRNGIGSVATQESFDETCRLLDGSATLRWCDANDANDPDGLTEVEERVVQLELAFEDVRAALADWNTSINEDRHQELKEMLEAILADVGLSRAG